MMIKLKKLIQEILLLNENERDNSYSWLNPDGMFFSVKSTHFDSAEKITGIWGSKSFYELFKQGWQRISNCRSDKNGSFTLYTNNEYFEPNYKQKKKLIELAEKFGFDEIVFEAKEGHYKTIWSAHDILQEEQQEIEYNENLISMLDTNGKFFPVFKKWGLHHADISKEIGIEYNELLKKGWQRIISSNDIIWSNNRYNKLPNQKQLNKLLELAIETGKNFIKWEGCDTENNNYKMIQKVLWSKENVLQEENNPTGNWEGWGNVTHEDKKELKIILEKLIKFIESIYHRNLSSTKVYLLKKIINNLDTSDVTVAAKILAKFGIEDRLGFGDFIDDNGGIRNGASKAFHYLLDVSRKFIEPTKVIKPDFVLRGWVKIQKIYNPNNFSDKISFGDVEIKGLEDMKPQISFAGYGSYILTKEWFDKSKFPYNKLALDLGQNIYCVNINEIMEAVRKELDKRNYKI